MNLWINVFVLIVSIASIIYAIDIEVIDDFSDGHGNAVLIPAGKQSAPGGPYNSVLPPCECPDISLYGERRDIVVSLTSKKKQDFLTFVGPGGFGDGELSSSGALQDGARTRLIYNGFYDDNVPDDLTFEGTANAICVDYDTSGSFTPNRSFFYLELIDENNCITNSSPQFITIQNDARMVLFYDSFPYCDITQAKSIGITSQCIDIDRISIYAIHTCFVSPTTTATTSLTPTPSPFFTF
mmetsp:Transcript_23463/g.40113  ORF Transcript_23463/g.40113 Transcript_23463/m.40113 type:complete len:240 (+) Transcript_23463:33-752(+)